MGTFRVFRTKSNSADTIYIIRVAQYHGLITKSFNSKTGDRVVLVANPNAGGVNSCDSSAQCNQREVDLPRPATTETSQSVKGLQSSEGMQVRYPVTELDSGRSFVSIVNVLIKGDMDETNRNLSE